MSQTLQIKIFLLIVVSAISPSLMMKSSLLRRSKSFFKLFSNIEAGSTKYAPRLLEQAIILQGPVASGYGRGSAKLGFPTANLPYFDTKLISSNISNGVYYGWAKVATLDRVHPTVVNIGYSPTFAGNENKVRIAEAYIIVPLLEQQLPPFYGEQLRLLLLGFIRPELKFSSIQALIDEIESDVAIGTSLCQKSLKPQAQLQSQSSEQIGITDEVLNLSFDLNTLSDEISAASYRFHDVELSKLEATPNNYTLWAKVINRSSKI